MRWRLAQTPPEKNFVFIRLPCGAQQRRVIRDYSFPLLGYFC
jgi:hypothetical protein